MKTKKALEGLLGLFGSLAAAAPAALLAFAGFLFTASLSTHKQHDLKFRDLES